MAKKKSSVAPILALLAVVCGVVAICMCFVTSVNVVGYTSTNYPYTGLQATFGYTAENSSISELAFSFMNLLPYILVIVAVVIAVLSLVGVSRSRLVKFIACGLFVVSGILFFCEGSFTVLGDLFNNTGTSIVGSLTGAEINVNITTGAIVAGITSIVGGALMLLNTFSSKN